MGPRSTLLEASQYHKVLSSSHEAAHVSDRHMPTAERMSEAEVSLRVAFHLLDRDLAVSDVEVAIDGAQVRTGGAIH